MHRAYDGDQDLNYYSFRVKTIVEGLFGNPIAKDKMHLNFARDIGPDGKRRFTDSHTCLAFEHVSEWIEEGVVPFSLVMYIDGTNQYKNVSVLPVYMTTRNYDKSIQNRPSAWKLLAVIPYYNLHVATLTPKERTYRRKEVCFSPH